MFAIVAFGSLYSQLHLDLKKDNIEELHNRCQLCALDLLGFVVIDGLRDYYFI
jgi:hypothetical protein